MFQNFVNQGEVSYVVETNRAIAPISQFIHVLSAKKESLCIAPQGPY